MVSDLFNVPKKSTGLRGRRRDKNNNVIEILLDDPTMVSDLFNVPKKSTSLRGFFNRKNDKYNSIIEIRSAAFDVYRTETDDDDTSTIRSHSTNSTVDNNPGPGRLIDKHIYQRLGRKLERFIIWIKPPMLIPAQILAYFEKQNNGHGIFYSLDPTYRKQSILDSFREKSAIYGLKCLVKQAQSSSCFRSSTALTALIRLAMLNDDLATFYIRIQNLEPIFNVEALVTSLGDSSIIKNYTLLLVKLAKAHAIRITYSYAAWHVARSNICSKPCLRPRAETEALSHDFLCLLEALPNEPTADDLLEAVPEVCRIYALAVQVAGSKDLDIEMIHFMIIFLLQSIPPLYSQADSVQDHGTQWFMKMVLTVFRDWLDISLRNLMLSFDQISDPENKSLKCQIAWFGLLQIHEYSELMLPKSFTHTQVRRKLVSAFLFPRRVCGIWNTLCQLQRRTDDISMMNPPLIKSLIEQSQPRIIRLLTSLTELKREVRDTMRARSTISKEWQDEEHSLQHEFQSDRFKKRTYSKAQRYRVQRNHMTAEFRQAREDYGAYHKYKTDCFWRRKWAQFFLCNFDWDWDLAESLELLYTLDEASPTLFTHTQQPETHIATIDAEGAVGQTWDMKTRATQLVHTELPREVRIPYASETGGTKFMVFSRDADMPRVSPEGSTGHDGDSGDRESIATAEIDERTGEEDADTTALEMSSENGSSLDFQECDAESWTAQDIDACPVIPSTDEALECEAFIEELAGEAEGETRIFEMSAELLQVPTKGDDTESDFAQRTSFAVGSTENHAFIEEMDDEKDGDGDNAASDISDESTQIHSSEIDSASASAGWVRDATVERNGIKWFQIITFFCASILLERLIIAMLGHFFGRGGIKT